ncbi:DUF1707 domain-containing protein [Actinoplanes sp. NBRC 103695]|uniref:DUF1707 SHOCT-like domain-containing protein n=1 Tax=Actinoplanes sp. NBRC 103695 TaxID=3032202 RepID=UPI0024A2BC3C|nr:DUF1707 domain-containing protein [Actinoplanes sp. NBRC 103695]GLY93707.1 hypothetical protein Acsp02_09630 [Actinoplanes sp. NBRC 103695]
MTTDDATRAGQHRLRTSDTEREQVATILRAAMTEGRLTLEEGEERLGACYAAKFRDDLIPLTADLPGNGRQALAHTPQAQAATRRDRRAFGGFVFVLSSVLVSLWFLSGAHFFWPIFPMFFLFMAFARHHGPAHQHYRRHQPVAPWNAP